MYRRTKTFPSSVEWSEIEHFPKIGRGSLRYNAFTKQSLIRPRQLSSLNTEATLESEPLPVVSFVLGHYSPLLMTGPVVHSSFWVVFLFTSAAAQNESNMHLRRGRRGRFVALLFEAFASPRSLFLCSRILALAWCLDICTRLLLFL